jgi:hypothetical protein
MWLIIGLIAGAAVLGLVLWLQSKAVSVKWYELLIGALGLVLLLFTIQNFTGSLTELESTAANMFLLVTGLPAIIVRAVSGLFVARRNRGG